MKKKHVLKAAKGIDTSQTYKLSKSEMFGII